MQVLNKNKAKKEEEEKIQSQIGLEINKKLFQSNIWKLYLFQFFIGFHMISGIMMPFFLYVLWIVIHPISIDSPAANIIGATSSININPAKH